MAIKLNWDRVKQLHSELESSGWKDNDKLFFILVENNGKPKKAIIQLKELYKFCWSLMDDDSFNILTFIIQDAEGRVLYRHRRIVGNEEIPNGGNAEIILHWPALTQDEKDTYITILMSQIKAYEQ